MEYHGIVWESMGISWEKQVFNKVIHKSCGKRIKPPTPYNTRT